MKITNTVEAQGQPLLQKYLNSVLVQLLLQSLIFIGGLVLVKTLVLRPALGLFSLAEDDFKLIQGLITLVLIFALYVGMVRFLEKRDVSELSSRFVLREGAQGSLFGFGAICLIVAAFWALGHFKILGLNPDLKLLHIVVPIFLFAAAEELFFRGILFRVVEKYKGTVWAFGVSAVIFGGLHISNEGANWITAFSAMTGGLLMCSLYAQSQRLWLPIFFHVSWNFGQVFYGTTVSGETILGKIFLSETTGPDWLTGGVQGPENSVLAIAVVTGLLGWSVRKLVAGTKPHQV